MKGLSLNSHEEALTRIVETVSGIRREAMRGKSRVKNIAIARSILGYMLRTDAHCTSKRAGDLVGRHHASVLKYVADHDTNYKYYSEYKRMYIKIQKEYIVGFRGAKINIMQNQIDELQKQLDIVKGQGEEKSNINQKQ